jgi:hypothetical protein
MKENKRFALLGVILLMPATLLVFLGLSGFNIPRVLDSPFAIMPGLALALLLNLKAILRFNAEHDSSGRFAAVTLRVETKMINLAVIAFGSLLTAFIIGYLFVENFRPR